MTDTRRVNLLLCSAGGDIVGRLPEFGVADPWWAHVEPVIVAARERFGVDVTILRLIGHDSPTDGAGGAVRYLAELDGLGTDSVLRAEPGAESLRDQPLRLPWARPGGVTRVVAWADEVLRGRERKRTGPAQQIKIWNLSVVLRVPTDDGVVWCKAVPPFLAHEGAIIDRIAEDRPELVSTLLGFDSAAGMCLMSEIPGTDQWAAPLELLTRMVSELVQLQAGWIGRTSELVALGLPSFRADILPELVTDALERPDTLAALPTDRVGPLRNLMGSLPARLTELAECGMPETLVRGDFHPGNWRYDGTHLVLLDWGDSAIGHPLLDTTSFLSRLPPADREPVRRAWIAAWRQAIPGSDPGRAATLIPPIAALRSAVVYRQFLDGIEPDERIYHQRDVPEWFLRALDPAGC